MPPLRKTQGYYTDIQKACSLSDKADVYYKKTVYDSAFIYYNSAKQLFSKHKDSLRLAYSMIRMADIQLSSGDYFGCESTATEALPFLTEKDTLKYHEQVYNLLGRCYRKLYNYKSANEYYNKAFAVTKGSLAKSIVSNNIASVYTDNGEYYKALTILEELNKSEVVANHPETKGRVLNNLGQIYYILKKPQAASYIKEGFAIRQNISDWRGMLSSYLLLSELYSQTNKALSKDYALKAYNLAITIKSNDNRLSALRLLMKKATGAEKVKRTEQYLAFSDSIEKVRMMAKSEFAKIKYDSAKIQEDLIKQEIKNRRDEEEHRFKVRLIIWGSVCVLLALVVFFYLKRMSYKEEKAMQTYVTETRISKKIHDELANDMFEVIVHAETHDFAQEEQKQKLIKDLDSIYNKTRDISRESNDIDTGENFPVVLKNMLADYNTSDISVVFIKYENIDWHAVSKPKKIAVYRVLQELMVNMKKHSGANVTLLRFNTTGKKVSINYSDNGKGLNSDEKFSKNGLQNADIRMKSVNGSITFEDGSENGLKVLIEFTL